MIYLSIKKKELIPETHSFKMISFKDGHEEPNLGDTMVELSKEFYEFTKKLHSTIKTNNHNIFTNIVIDDLIIKYER